MGDCARGSTNEQAMAKKSSSPSAPGTPRATPRFDIYAGLSGLELTPESFDLGEGVTVNRTYAHLMAPFMMAFKEPAEYDQPHPGPWKSLNGGIQYDIEAEIRVPATIDPSLGTQMDVARMIGTLLRLGVHPVFRIPAFSNHPFATMGERPERESWLIPNEFFPRFFPLDSEADSLGETELEWVAQRWPIALRLSRESAAFALALEAIDNGQFVARTALTLVSIWAALEALFSPAKSELRFRVSAQIAAYLEPQGEERMTLQRSIAKLYDKRSAAAHGLPKHDTDDLLETFNLLARALHKMLDERKVPTMDDLERALFGVG